MLISYPDDVGGVDIFPLHCRRFHPREFCHDGPVNSIVSALIAERHIADDLDASDLWELAKRALRDLFCDFAKSADRGCFAGCVRLDPELDDQALVRVARSRKGLRAVFGNEALC